MTDAYRLRRTVLAGFLFVFLLISIGGLASSTKHVNGSSESGNAALYLEKLIVKDQDPGEGYSRSQFGDGWTSTNGCDTRNLILYRDLRNAVADGDCNVTHGVLDDPYTGETIQFVRGKNSADVQIDHVVALSNAWRTGAQSLDYATRVKLANDPLELLAVSGKANQEKSDSDASSWLPSNKAYRCIYVARQISIKYKYHFWLTKNEKAAMRQVLGNCKDQDVMYL